MHNTVIPSFEYRTTCSRMLRRWILGAFDLWGKEQVEVSSLLHAFGGSYSAVDAAKLVGYPRVLYKPDLD
jgi:hypothetical protein